MLNVDLTKFNGLIERYVSKRERVIEIVLRELDYGRYKRYRETPNLVMDFEQEVSLNNSLLSYDGHGVIVYIKEQADLSLAIYAPVNGATKYHLTDCKTLQDEKTDKRFGRFVAMRYVEGKMPVCDDQGNEGYSALIVCGNCLRKLKYTPYIKAGTKEEKKRVQIEFDLTQFLKEQHCFPDEYLPLRHADVSNFSYSDDWKTISEIYKLSKDHCCEECGVQLKHRKELLHTHHIDGVKSNNHPANLMSLCVDCHSKQPKHGHLKPNIEVLKYLEKSRMR
ncbi:HNH endonuclease [Vibrio astriarenae]|uniref:HNH endonuclease n=1 Tax=Vibrio astriarenae TaxID=1481923 RepID=A0A7Z2T6T4_9VIBR|nr:HNH endonuclease [Vibrio astriarenae]QIA65406.1 HNH endonuclease [Vibrio astriarenae]